jgi:hypothetical protein
MEPLMSDMVQNDPEKRHTMGEFITQIKGKLSMWKL